MNIRLYLTIMIVMDIADQFVSIRFMNNFENGEMGIMYCM